MMCCPELAMCLQWQHCVSQKCLNALSHRWEKPRLGRNTTRMPGIECPCEVVGGFLGLGKVREEGGTASGINPEGRMAAQAASGPYVWRHGHQHRSLWFCTNLWAGADLSGSIVATHAQDREREPRFGVREPIGYSGGPLVVLDWWCTGSAVLVGVTKA